MTPVVPAAVGRVAVCVDTAACASSFSLAIGALPYAIGAIALRDNTVAREAGPWLLWMLAGPLYAALLALACLVAPCLGRLRSGGRAPVPGHA
ncbi:MAG: hypothetical protein JNK78_05265 [Planctomycetes bacterium]|nr:hypothetical protein [Planctomycetota bacterium]